MSEQERSERYEAAMSQLEKYIKRAQDGTFRLEIEDGKSIGVDPVVFEDLKRSLEETNRKIRQGELSPEQVTDHVR
jgi:exonuclease VII small subunit